MSPFVRCTAVALLTAVIWTVAAQKAFAHERDSLDIDPACVGDIYQPSISLLPEDAGWLNEYLTLGEVNYVLSRGLTLDMLRCYREREAKERGVGIQFSAPRFSRAPSPGVEKWRPLVEAYFQPEWVEWAMRIMECESRGDPYAQNPSSGAAGLFQHLPKYWEERSASAGWTCKAPH